MRRGVFTPQNLIGYSAESVAMGGADVALGSRFQCPLCDMNVKYADVVKTAELLQFVDGLPAGMFDLTKGSQASPFELVPEDAARSFR